METLTERNLDLEEKVRELRETVSDLVSDRRWVEPQPHHLHPFTVLGGEERITARRGL